jgi:hypothetical protein
VCCVLLPAYICRTATTCSVSLAAGRTGIWAFHLPVFQVQACLAERCPTVKSLICHWSCTVESHNAPGQCHRQADLCIESSVEPIVVPCCTAGHPAVLLLCHAVVAAGAVALVWCLWVAYEWVQQRRNRSTVPVQSVRAHRWHYLVLYVVLTLFFLYPRSGFVCQLADAATSPATCANPANAAACLCREQVC